MFVGSVCLCGPSDLHTCNAGASVMDLKKAMASS